MIKEVEAIIDEETFNSILLGNKTCIHSFNDDNIGLDTQIELIETIKPKKRTGRKIFVRVTHVEHIKEPFNLFLFSIEVIGASNI
jgi:hypothetical protein